MNETFDKQQLYDYLLQTQVQTEALDYPLKRELDTLIELFDTDEFVPYLRQITQKETTMIEKGMLEDEDGDGIGFFGALLQLVEGSLDGLGRINWTTLKNRTRRITHKINRVNPATVAARNSLRALIAMNIFGYATAINRSAQVKRKVVDMYRRLGGKESYILQAIATGARKRPLFAKKGTVHGLGSTDISILLRRAGTFLSQIKTWLNQEKAKQKNTELDAIVKLLEMNIYGYAAVLAKNASIKSKVISLYVRKGGKKQDIERAIAVGARKHSYTPNIHKQPATRSTNIRKTTSTHITRRSPIRRRPSTNIRHIFNRTSNRRRPSTNIRHIFNHPPVRRRPPFPRRPLHGYYEDLGEPVSIASMLAAAGGLLAQIKKWIQAAGIDPSKISHTSSHSTAKAKSQTNISKKPQAHTPAKQTTTTAQQTQQIKKIAAPTAAPETMPSQTSATVNVGGSKKGVKIAIGLGVAGLTGVALYKWQQHKKHTLKGITLN